MRGVRRDGTGALSLAVGEYKLDRGREQFTAVLPSGELVVLAVREGPSPEDPRTWGFTEHENGSLSIHPSIDAHGQYPWHGFLVAGEWVA